MQQTNTKPNIDILFEDNHLLIINKPAGVLSQEDYSGDPDVLTLCKKYLKVRYNKPGNVYLGLVHRLDRPVGGVMALAKTSKAASRLSEQIRKRTMEKTYRVVVHGEINVFGDLVHHLKKDNRRNLVEAKNKPSSDTKESRLQYIRLDYQNKFSLAEINLITGRPHQIRVQFAAEGHPVWGDEKYGKESNSHSDIALFAFKLGLVHPTKKEKLVFEAPLPDSYPWNSFES